MQGILTRLQLPTGASYATVSTLAADLGNTVIVVEHDIDMMLQADYIVDIGPGAGRHGGRVIAAGSKQAF